MAKKKIDNTEKIALLNSIKEKMNYTEYETLGLTVTDSLDHLRELSENLNKAPDESKRADLRSEEEKAEDLETKDEETEPVNDNESFDELLGKIKGATPPEDKPEVDLSDEPLIKRTRTKKKKGESNPDTTRIEGYILLIAVDTVFPFGLAFLNNMLDKKNKRVEPKDLQLDQKSFDKLESLANQAADYLELKVNPVAGFFIAASFMYGNNLLAIKMQK